MQFPIKALAFLVLLTGLAATSAVPRFGSSPAVFTSLTEARARSRMGMLTSVAIEGRSSGGGVETGLGSSGARAGDAAAASSAGTAAGRGPLRVLAGSAAAANSVSQATSGVAHSGGGGGPVSEGSTSTGQAAGVGSGVSSGRRRRRAEGGVSGYEGSSGVEVGQSSAVLALGNVVGRGPEGSTVAAGSTGVTVGGVSTAVSLGSALQTLAVHRPRSRPHVASAVNAASTAARAHNSASSLSVGTSSIKTLHR